MSVISDSLGPHGWYSPWNSPGQNTGVGSLSLLQGIFPIQGLNPGLLHCRWILHQLSHKGSPRILERVAYLFSSRSSDPGIELGSPACRQILYQLSYQGTKRYIQKLIHFSIKIKVFLKIKIFLREASSLKSEHWLSMLIQSPRLSKRKGIWGTSNIQRFQNWVNTAIHRFKKPANPKNLKNKQKLHTDRCTALKLQNLKAA